MKYQVSTQDIICGSNVWPSAYRIGEFSDKLVCCKLHDVVVFPSREGCGSWNVGSHYAVVAANAGQKPICHAEVGSRVIDDELFGNVVFPNESFVQRSLNKGSRFMKRYYGGYSVDVSVYGAGYCYLQLFDSRIRSRIARCLGPCPYVADVLRFLWFMSLDYYVSARVQFVRAGLFHVIPSAGYTFMNLVCELFDLIQLDCMVRVGADEEEWRIIAALTSSDGFIIRRRLVDVPRHGMDLHFPMFIHYVDESMWPASLCLRDDSYPFFQFLKSIDCEIMTLGARYWLSIAIRAPAIVANIAKELKNRIKVFSMHGDVVIKMMQSAYCNHAYTTPEFCSKLYEYGSNKNLTIVFSKTIRQYCSMIGLDVSSSAGADMLEAVIGVIHHCEGANTTVKFLKHLELLPSQPVTASGTIFRVESIDSGSGGTVRYKLTDEQYNKAVDLVKRGII